MCMGIYIEDASCMCPDIKQRCHKLSMLSRVSTYRAGLTEGRVSRAAPSTLASLGRLRSRTCMSWEDCYKLTSCRPVKWRMWILQCASQVLLLYLQLPYP